MKNEKKYTRQDAWLLLVLGMTIGLIVGMIFIFILFHMKNIEKVHDEYCQELGFDYAQGVFSGNNGVFYTPDIIPFLRCCYKEKVLGELFIVPEKCRGIVYK